MTRLSNRQYPMLEIFAEGRSFLSIAQAQTFDQRPFRSMLIRDWVSYVPTKGFRITEKGKAAWDEFRHTEIARKNPLAPLTAYFDPTAYGLAPVRKKRRKTVAARAGAA